MKSVRLSKKLEKLPPRTFAACESLTYLEIPARVTEISERCFEYTPLLKTIRLRGKVKVISDSAFQKSGVETIIVPWYLKNYYKRLLPNFIIKSAWK